MAEYYLEFDCFSFSEEGIHLLRNRYCYNKISFPEIYSLTFKKGKTVNNWFALSLLGLGLIIAALYYVSFTINEYKVIGGFKIMAGVLIAGFCGAMIFIQSIKSTLVLEVKGRSLSYTCRFDSNIKFQELDHLLSFLERKCPGRLRVESKQMPMYS